MHPVPLPISFAAILLLLPACAAPRGERVPDTSGTAGSAAASLAGTAWELQEIDGAAALARAQATLQFESAERVAGRGSCNRFNGPVEVRDSTIAFGTLAATRMACADEVMRQESRYFAALSSARWYRVEGDTLTIHRGDGAQPLRFARTLD